MASGGGHGIFRRWMRELFLDTGGTVAEADRVVDRVLERRRHLTDAEKRQAAAAAVERAACRAEQSTRAMWEDFLRRRKNR